MEFMTEEELAIAQLKNIRSIHIMSLLDMINIIVFYNQSDSLNYCQADRLFDMFMEKIMIQYQLEKTNHPIEVTGDCASILTNGYMESKNSISKFYLNKQSYPQGLLYYGDLQVQTIEDILKYHIQKIYSFLHKDIKLNNITGYRKNHVIDANLEGEDIYLPFTLLPQDNYSYQITIGATNTIQMNLQFKNNQIHIFWTKLDHSLSGTFQYEIRQGKLLEEISVSSPDRLQYYHKDFVKEETTKEQKELLETYLAIDQSLESEYSIAKFPWQAYYLYSDHNYLELPQYHQCLSSSIYMGMTDTYIGIRQFIEKMIKSKNNGYQFRTDGVIKNINIYHRDFGKNHYGICETKFDGLEFARGDYKNQLSDHYFYHVFKSGKSLLIPQPIQLIPIEKRDDIQDGSQLLQEETLKILVKRGVK